MKKSNATGAPVTTGRDSPAGTQSIERAARILREIASYSVHGLRLVDLATQLKLERPTIHRILTCLIRERLVMQHPQSRRYLLGHALFELGLTAATQFKLRALCHPSLKRIADQTGDVAFLTSRTGLDAISIARIEGGAPIDIAAVEIGVRRPLGVGAGSLALLMVLPDDEIKRIVHANAKRLFAYGTLTVPLLLQIVKSSQELGYAVHDSRVIPGLSGIGMVVRNSTGAPLAAISVTAMAESLTVERQQKIVALLRRESHVIQNLVHQANIDVTDLLRQEF
jgi:DNA-binding IclR family transcriptional regulator